MINTAKLAGLTVIDPTRREKGKVVSAEPGKVVVEWAPKTQTLSESDSEFAQVKVVTEGAEVSATDFIQVSTSLADELASILAMDSGVEALEESKKKKGKKSKGSSHNPFKNNDSNGEGPPHPPNKPPNIRNRVVHKQNDWSCHCSDYKCSCIGIGKDNKGDKKTVRIDKGYKKGYNKNYKAWVAGKKKK